ncbi:MAG: DNA/RNA nuclease SfsA [Clostridia bacterium]|nr:DNA/RNA nuclease SfsA [Clostridia bacterium]
MKYARVVEGRFISRPNRFIAHVEIDGVDTVCHVKNTGRCKELLIPGAKVYLAVSDHPNRKTKHDLIAVEKGDILINMDSQAPNEAAFEAMTRLFPHALSIKREYTYGDSRFDLHLELPDGEVFIEVKGVTLEREGHLYFPDAPTQRGAKHLRGLIRCVEEGHRAMVLFVAQMKGVYAFSPNDATDPVFADTLRMAARNGVEVRCMDCIVQPDSMVIDGDVPVEL